MIRPDEPTWVAPTGASAAEFLSGLSGKDRRNVRAAERMLAEARNRRVGRVSLGSDLNLYGHIVQPGLFSFKCRLGFRAYPAQAVLGDGHDLAERVLGPRRLPGVVRGRCLGVSSACLPRIMYRHQ